ncbi:MAG: FkbM family methyltransferase [Candidatus Methanomethyliaceae archaeon]
MRLNGYEKQVRLENLAVSDGSCDRLLLFPGRGHSSFEWNIVGHDVKGNRTEPELEVAATCLDAYFPPGSRLNFVKVDVEGAEALVLRGMRRLLRETRPVVVVEFHDENGWAGRKELFAAGYYPYDMHGRRVDPVHDIRRLYHCLALPQEMTQLKSNLEMCNR